MSVNAFNNKGNNESTPTTTAKIRINQPKAKRLSNLKLYCWECESVLTLSQTEGGLPVACDKCGEYMITPKNPFGANVVIDDFVIKTKIASGGAGTVYLAYQRTLNRLCALKILNNNYTNEHELLKEARIAARLNHPNIVQCYAASTTDKLCYYAMEFVSRRTLQKILDTNWKIPQVKAVKIAIQVCKALDYGWKANRLVHHDVKPENIMINENGEIKLADLGLAKLGYESETRTDNIFRGTPTYASPEVIKGEENDFRGDMYSLGAVLYHALTGRPPFEHIEIKDTLKSHLTETATNPRELDSDLNKTLVGIIMKLLCKDPKDRYPNYDSLLTALRKVRTKLHSSDMKTTCLLLDSFNEDDLIEKEGKKKNLFSLFMPQK